MTTPVAGQLGESQELQTPLFCDELYQISLLPPVVAVENALLIVKSKSLRTRLDELHRTSRDIVLDVTPFAEGGGEPRVLGEGRHAEVFWFRVGPRSLVAYKSTVLFEDEKWDTQTMHELVIESRLFEALTRYFVLPSLDVSDNDTPSCPNFVALLRTDFSDRVFRRHTDHRVRIEACEHHVTSMFLEVCQPRNLRSLTDTHVGPAHEDRAKQMAASIAGQLLIAILAMASIGVVHNDLRFTNILLLSHDTPEEGLLYCIPGEGDQVDDVYMRLPGGKGIPLLVVSDFGCSCVVNWLHDPRYEPPSLATPESLAMLYYAKSAEGVVRKNFTRLSLTSHDEVGFYRPLRFTKINHFERDTATLFTTFEHMGKNESDIRRWLVHLGKIGTAVIDELTRTRPRCYPELLITVLNLLSSCDYLSKCIVRQQPQQLQSAWRLPTLAQGAAMNSALLEKLNEPRAVGNLFNLF